MANTETIRETCDILRISGPGIVQQGLVPEILGMKGTNCKHINK